MGLISLIVLNISEYSVAFLIPFILNITPVKAKKENEIKREYSTIFLMLFSSFTNSGRNITNILSHKEERSIIIYFGNTPMPSPKTGKREELSRKRHENNIKTAVIMRIAGVKTAHIFPSDFIPDNAPITIAGTIIKLINPSGELYKSENLRLLTYAQKENERKTTMVIKINAERTFLIFSFPKETFNAVLRTVYTIKNATIFIKSISNPEKFSPRRG